MYSDPYPAANAWLSGLSRYPYTDDIRLTKVCLDKNEWIGRVPSYLTDSLNNFPPEYAVLYPSLNNLYLQLSTFHSLPTDYFLATAGLDLGIRTCFETYVRPSTSVLTLDPTYAMVSVYAHLYRANILGLSAFELKPEQVITFLESLDTCPSLIVIASPNSPTGSALPVDSFQHLLTFSSTHQIPFLLDEAYVEFSDQNFLHYIHTNPQLIVGRTFSKSFGLAGLRVGYLISNPKNIANLTKVKPMYETSSISAYIASQALLNYHIASEYCNEVVDSRTQLQMLLDKCNIPYLPSDANFLNIDATSLDNLDAFLADNDLLIPKPYSHPAMLTYRRFSLGTLESSTLLFNYFNQYLS